MKLVFLTNLVNHHQIHVADELFKVLGNDYKYVAFEPLPDWLRQGGYSEIKRPYILNAYEDENKYEQAVSLANEADVVIIGSAPEKLVHKRQSENKLTLHYNERWFKKKIGIKIFSPIMWYHIFLNHLRYNNKKSYMLCASAYAPYDLSLIRAYKNRCFKWGYFTKVDELDINSLLSSKDSEPVSIMWCARFLKWKHPEIPVFLANRLKAKGYKVIIDMFGSGEELESTKYLAEQLNVKDLIRFRGNFPNDMILEEMRRHHIFLFTSDRNEGWGAVLNEAMSNGCAVVASKEIGSVPYLIKDGVNGFYYKCLDIDSLLAKVELLITDSSLRKRLSKEAYVTMLNVWSPENAAHSLMKLLRGLEADPLYRIEGEGPCSVAGVIKG